MSKPRAGGQSGVEGGCGVLAGGGTPWSPAEELPELGATPQQIAEQVEGSHRFDFTWQPWWQSPDSSAQRSESLALEVEWLGATRVQPCLTELDVDVRLHDANGEIDATARGVLRPYLRDEATRALDLVVRATLDDPTLAEQLGLPPAATAGEDRELELSAMLRDGVWSASLGEIRRDNVCPLLSTPAEPAERCDRYTQLFQKAGPAQELYSTDGVGDDGFTASDAIAAFDRLGAIQIRFEDGTVSAARLEITAEDFACAARFAGPIAEHREPDLSQATETIVVVPARARLVTEDGTLDITLDAQITVAISDADGWDGTGELYGMLTPLASLQSQGAKFDRELPPGDLHVLSFTLDAPAMENARLSLEGYALDSGVPSFPDVAETSSTRLDCFGRPAGASEAVIQVEPR